MSAQGLVRPSNSLHKTIKTRRGLPKNMRVKHAARFVLKKLLSGYVAFTIYVMLVIALFCCIFYGAMRFNVYLINIGVLSILPPTKPPCKLCEGFIYTLIEICVALSVYLVGAGFYFCVLWDIQSIHAEYDIEMAKFANKKN